MKPKNFVKKGFQRAEDDDEVEYFNSLEIIEDEDEFDYENNKLMGTLTREVMHYEIQTLMRVIYVKIETMHILVKEKEGMTKDIDKVKNANKELEKKNMRLEERCKSEKCKK